MLVSMLIVNPNIATDRTIPVGVLVPGSVHRTGTAVTTLGGKGINVARIGRAFRHRAVVVTFLPAGSADQLTQLAAAEQAELAGVPVPGTARAASILLEGSGRVTVLNEPGPARDAGEWRHLLAEIERQAPGHQSLVCSGSLPPGSPADAYAQIVAIGQRAGLRTIVDAAGPALAGVCRPTRTWSAPTCPRPNRCCTARPWKGWSRTAPTSSGAPLTPPAAWSPAGRGGPS